MEVSHLFGNVLNFQGGPVPGHFVSNFVYLSGYCISMYFFKQSLKKMVIKKKGIIRAESVTGFGYHRDTIRYFLHLLLYMLTFVERCNAHIEIWRILRT
jgi:hypothetical protein